MPHLINNGADLHTFPHLLLKQSFIKCLLFFKLLKRYTNEPDSCVWFYVPIEDPVLMVLHSNGEHRQETSKYKVEVKDIKNKMTCDKKKSNG